MSVPTDRLAKKPQSFQFCHSSVSAPSGFRVKQHEYNLRTFDWSLMWICFLSTLLLTLAKHLQFFWLSVTLTAFPAGWAMSCLCCRVSLAVPGQVSNIWWCRKCWSPGRYSPHVLINHTHTHWYYFSQLFLYPLLLGQFITFLASFYPYSGFKLEEKVRKLPDGY